MRHAAGFAVLIVALLAGPAAAQNSREAERRLETVQRELRKVAAERRKIEGQRGSASRELRAVDEKVGQTSRALREAEQTLATDEQRLAQLQRERDAMRARVAAQRAELAQLLRAAYRERDDAPLKALLSQDRVADAGRTLTYHRYLQRDRARRIEELTAQIGAVEAMERDILARRSRLDRARAEQRARLGTLERDRLERARMVAELEQQFRDRSTREKALGRDAKGLQQLLRKLRAAAARAEAQRRAAAKAERAAPRTNGAAPRRPAAVASAAPLQVGGLGWPLSGALLAGYGARMPDGRGSDGLLIAASAGAPVKAVADGSVVYAEWMTGYGLLLIVDHGNGYMSLYAHNDALLKDVGAAVKRGDTVSTVGSSGGQGRPALYFELRRNGQPVNPNVWLRR
ncbi:murein hydrolase activator EnvC family protein [Cognatilysobacter tabacisoli]|uniref:murein hydrolase activator EnvC family protein n=1 Tax=Cognatilysobacter tabacisoli TaxID=2315424 RepID=UPI000E6B02FB|nr:peptidoglycan DD-metalloendopeptidase family protein [Lysobacter tabacisoli]